jgi:hypothetical protein
MMSDIDPRDIMNRTIENLDVINYLHQKNGDVPEGTRFQVYEVTQLVNSFLAALAHPWETFKQELKGKSLRQAQLDGWPSVTKDDPRDKDPEDLATCCGWFGTHWRMAT